MGSPMGTGMPAMRIVMAKVALPASVPCWPCRGWSGEGLFTAGHQRAAGAAAVSGHARRTFLSGHGRAAHLCGLWNRKNGCIGCRKGDDGVAAAAGEPVHRCAHAVPSAERGVIIRTVMCWLMRWRRGRQASWRMLRRELPWTRSFSRNSFCLSAPPPLDVKDEAPGPRMNASVTRPISPQP